MKWVWITLMSLAGLVGLMALIGLVLPKGHRASKTTTLGAPPATIFDAIVNVSQYPQWRKDVTKVEMLPEDQGRTMFREHGSQGPITYRIETVTAPERAVFRIADTSLAFGGTWTHELRPSAGGGTDLTTTEDGEVYNPIFRFMSKFFFSPTATIEAYHSALAARVR